MRISLSLPKWTAAEHIGYEPKTTFWQDFSIADKFGASAIKDTFNRAFAEWKNNVVYLTELALVLNHKSWQFYDMNMPPMSKLYVELYNEVDEYACNNLKDDDLTYYYDTLD